MSEGEEAETELSQTSCPAYEKLLEVMERATARLHLPWERTKMVAPPGRLDERYLSGHKPPAQVSLPFLPDLHTEVEREWKKQFSSRIHRFQHTSYTNIARMRESGYERMPPVEETLASYLSMGDTASLKVPSLPFKSLQDTSRLNGRAYAAAGQAVASLHTMAVLQAYQADLLKDLDDGQGLSPDEVAELRRTTDLALRATKQAATAMGRSMAAMVVTGKASVGELGWPREEREGLSSRCASLAFRAFRYLRRDGGRKVQGGEGALSSLWNLHPKKAQVWARTKQGSWPGLVWGLETGTEG